MALLPGLWAAPALAQGIDMQPMPGPPVAGPSTPKNQDAVPQPPEGAPRGAVPPGDGVPRPGGGGMAKAGKAESWRDWPLDKLFGALKEARTPEQGAALEGVIKRHWILSGSPTIDVLMQRALESVQAKKPGQALDLFDAMLVMRPDHVGAWAHRGAFHLHNDNLVMAVADLRMALRLEPRQFDAMRWLAQAMLALGDKAAALELYRRVLALHPTDDETRQAVERLVPEVEGHSG